MSSQEINFGKTTVDRVIELLKNWENGNFFKKFIYGDPGPIPQSDMPCVIVDLVNAAVQAGPTGLDQSIETIDIGLVINKHDTYSDFDDDTTTEWKKRLELMVQGNDPVSQQYDPTTLLGVLRTNFTLGDYAINQTMRINYGEIPRSGSQDDEYFTGEAHILFTVTHYQQVPSRT